MRNVPSVGAHMLADIERRNRAHDQAAIDRRRSVRAYVAAHPGATSAAIARALDLSVYQCRLGSIRGVVRRGTGYYVEGDP